MSQGTSRRARVMDDHPMESAVQVLLPLLSAHPPSYPPSKMFSQQPYDAARVVGIIALTSKALRSRLQKDSDLVALVADHLMPGWTIWKLPNEAALQAILALLRVRHLLAAHSTRPQLLTSQLPGPSTLRQHPGQRAILQRLQPSAAVPALLLSNAQVQLLQQGLPVMQVHGPTLLLRGAALMATDETIACYSMRLRTNPHTGQPCSGLWLLTWQGTVMAEVYLHEVPLAAATDPAQVGSAAGAAGASGAGDRSYRATAHSSAASSTASSTASTLAPAASSAARHGTRCPADEVYAEVYAEVSERFLQLLRRRRHQQQLQQLVQQHPAAAEQEPDPAAVAESLCAMSILRDMHKVALRQIRLRGWAHKLGLPADTQPAAMVLAAVQQHITHVVSANARRMASGTVREVSVLPVGAAAAVSAPAALLQLGAACGRAGVTGSAASDPLEDAVQLRRHLQLLAASGLPVLDLTGLLLPLEGEGQIRPGGDGGAGSSVSTAGGCAGAAAGAADADADAAAAAAGGGNGDAAAGAGAGAGAAAGAAAGGAGAAIPAAEWRAAAGRLVARIRAIPDTHPDLAVLLLPVLLPTKVGHRTYSDMAEAVDDEELLLPRVPLQAPPPAVAAWPRQAGGRGPAWQPPELPQSPPCPVFSKLRACMEPAFEELALVARRLPALQHVVLLCPGAAGPCLDLVKAVAGASLDPA